MNLTIIEEITAYGHRMAIIPKFILYKFTKWNISTKIYFWPV